MEERHSLLMGSYLVQKFGGTSLADVPCVQRVAHWVEQELKNGYQVVVVVSAMAGVTNQLLSWVRAAGPYNTSVKANPESDVVLASGEQVSAGLLALALQNLGLSARSWLGWQLPIITQGPHGSSRIVHVETKTLKERLSQGEVPIITGFQGMTIDGRVTTLGRGGSDTTAVALAAFLKAERCDIYTDVEGVYTADPIWVKKAQKFGEISYDEMFALASNGARVLNPDSVTLAQKYHVPLRVVSSHSPVLGTWVSSCAPSIRLVSGITHTFDCIQLSFETTLDKWGVIRDLLIQNKVSFDMVMIKYQGLLRQFLFTISQEDRESAIGLLKQVPGVQSLSERGGIVKISVIKGSGASDDKVTNWRQVMLSTLAAKGVKILGLSASPGRTSVVIESEQAHDVLDWLHQAYELHRL